jgi:hypothetical protein
MKIRTLNTKPISRLRTYLFALSQIINHIDIRKIGSIGVITIAIFVSGCAGVSGGIGIKLPNVSNEAMQSLEQKIKDKAARTAIEYTAKAMDESKPTGPGMIVIGTLGSKTNFGFFSRSSAYSSFIDQLQKSGALNKPTKEEFLETFDGVVLIATTNAVIGFTGRTVLTLKGSDDHFGYASLAAMALIGPIGDLVITQTNEHGTFYLYKTLCRRSDADYSACSDRYRKGTYDRETGKPISLFGNLDVTGDSVDPTTYMRLDFKPDNQHLPPSGRQQSFGSN